MARYRKIDPRAWKDEGMRKLTLEEKAIAIYMFSGQSNRIGIFNFSPAMAAEDLETFPQTFQEGFGKVLEVFHWRFDKASRVLYIPTWFKYNCPENPNVLLHCLQDLHDLPDTPLLAAFQGNLAYLPETFHETFLKGCRIPSPKPSPKQEQEQEQEQEPLATTTTVGVAKAPLAVVPVSEPATTGGPPGDISPKLVKAVRDMQVKGFHGLAELTHDNEVFWNAQLEIIERHDGVSVYACLRDVDAYYASRPEERPRTLKEATRRMKSALEVAVKKIIDARQPRHRRISHGKRATG
jgi:hypothetical protein